MDTLDSDSSLRAAALLSRKRKRLSADAPVLPPRLAPEPVLQLDYGFDDPQSVEDFEDGQIREEGEISDTEASSPPTPPPRPAQFTSDTANVDSSSSSSSPPHTSPLDPSDAQSSSVEPFVLETCTYRLDANHARPGLTMTQDEYNHAKDLVLDILGWGVPPEYLLECGLTRQVVFYVFSELSLRLPNNLDTTGLIPYPTPEMLALVSVSPSPSPRSPHSPSSTMPPPVFPPRISLVERMGIGHIDTRMSSPVPSPYIKPEPSSPSSSDLVNAHSLHMIEQQRRQELLARKAVIASRKSRQSEPPGFVTPTKDQDVDTNAVPAQSVDDFLKTIEHPPPLDLDEYDRVAPIVMDRMDVDVLIPRDAFASHRPESVVTRSSMDLPPTSTGLASTSTDQRPATFVDLGSPIPPLRGNPSLDDDSSHPQRRGVKRPVAADFVDFDNGPGFLRQGSSFSNGHSNGYPNLLSKRKAGSFAGVSAIRRCVIELSDSEDDGDSPKRDQVGDGDAREYSPAITAARVPSRLTVTPTMPSSSGVANGNAGLPVTSATSALAEKEEEIKRMRRLIAQREESRSKKIAAMSGKSTSIMVKQDETPVSPLSRDSSSTMFTSQERGCDRASSPELTRRHGIFVAVADGKPELATCNNSATVRTLGTNGSTGTRNDLNQETSIGRVQNGETEDEQDLQVTWETQSTRAVSATEEDIDHESLAAGDSGTSSSAQVLRSQLPQIQNEAPLQASRSGFPLYDSPLARYPLLRPRSGPDPSAPLVSSQSETTIASQAGTTPRVHFSSPVFCEPSAVSSHPSSPIPLPDLKELKQAALHRALVQLTRRSPDLRVCPYEVPGGGVCRDRDCGELHLGLISEEPSDTEVAAYVHRMLPRPWSGRCDVRAIEIALEGVRLRGGATDVDGRIREALGGLGIPMS